MVEERDERFRVALARLGAPKHLTSFRLSIAGPDQLAEVACTYHPSNADGSIMHGQNADALEVLAAEFVLVPRKLFNTLPDSFKRAARLK